MPERGGAVSDRYLEMDFAKLDMSRRERTGCGETIYGPGKTCGQLAEIMCAFQAADTPAMATKCTPEQFGYLQKMAVPVSYDPVSRIIASSWGNIQKINGSVAVCTGGTADIPVAEEAAQTAQFFGADVEKFYDIGVAGIHRLLDKADSIRKADVIIAVAGMEGALGSVISGLVEAPVIAVPTSVGYGAGFGGLAPLLAMLNSCAEGMSVVNIDNGFGAAVTACRMIRMMNRKVQK